MKDKIIIIISVLCFGVIGIYLTFFAGNARKFDSSVKAYKIETREQADIDGTLYYPIYYYRVNGQEYKCEAKVGSSSMPNSKKNIVYYDSKAPDKCLAQYEASSSKIAGIICLIVTVLIFFFGLIKKPSSKSYDYEEAEQRIEEKANEIMAAFSKAQLIIKRIILGIIILVLFVFILIDTALLKQTLKSKKYIETTATFIEKKDKNDDFYECIYVFKDKKGNENNITISCSEESSIKDKIKVRYNEKNPEDFYEENALLNKKGIIWYVVKIIALILLTVLFFNKRILSKINFSVSSN